MTIQRLKDFTYNTLVPEGYSMSFKQPTVQDLDTLIEIANSAKEELILDEDASKDVEDKVKDELHYLLYKLDHLVHNCHDLDYINDEMSIIKDDMFELTFFKGSLDGIDSPQAFYNAAKRHIEGM
tara:strand:- start:110 stop:484 length:375 start_codon:yes stop_codon:yes gene_type:complete